MKVTYNAVSDVLCIVFSDEDVGNVWRLNDYTTIGYSIIHKFGRYSHKLVGITVRHATEYLPEQAVRALKAQAEAEKGARSTDLTTVEVRRERSDDSCAQRKRR